MSLYLDASVLVASLTNELRSDEAREIITGYPSVEIGFSSWTLVEALSGLSKKVRTGHLKREDFHVLEAQIDAFPDSHARALITEEHFHAAGRLVADLEMGLRAGDALHLAIAADYDLALATFDDGLTAAARKVGVTIAPGKGQ